MALTANKEVIAQEGKLVSLKCAVAHIYKGALVKINAAGFLAPCASEAGSEFAGVAYEEVDNSAGSAGDKECRVIMNEMHVLKAAGMAQADAGSKVYATDDEVVTVTSAASKQVVGNIVKVLSATEVLVKLAPFSGVGS